ncbi:hypothetical protein SAMN05192550_0441 [Flavobacterium glycines]|uniref:Transposase n=1 Tax=Flavobacterium glycines TaxID=551990 RepID=A0A1G8MA45_9FLAO|nr:hypothetical protein SAMN05192550_0441 [Flavobacterium glycines]
MSVDWSFKIKNKPLRNEDRLSLNSLNALMV